MRMPYAFRAAGAQGPYWILIWVSLALAALLGASRVYSLPWSLDSTQDLSHIKLDELQQRFPSVAKPEDLSALLRALSQQHPMAKVEAYQEDDGRVLIRLLPAASISKIEVISLTRKLRQEIEGKLSKYMGQTDSQELRQQVLAEVDSILGNEAYFLAKAVLDKKADEQNVVYVITID